MEIFLYNPGDKNRKNRHSFGYFVGVVDDTQKLSQI